MLWTRCYLFSLLSTFVFAGLQLSHLRTTYLPYQINPEKFGFDKGTIEQIAYSSDDQLIYTVGSEIMHVIDITSVGNMSLVYSQRFDNEDFTDVEACGDYVFTASINISMPGRGFIKIFRKYDRVTNNFTLAHAIEVESLPDMVLPLSDCKTAVIALEGERFQHPTTNEWIDPLGEVGILEFPNGLGMNVYNLTKLNFREYDSELDTLKTYGVRAPYINGQTAFSAHVEPEYVTVDEESKTAYISLQENNAIAEIDLKSKTIIGIHGLGYKQWGYLDTASNDEIEITYWPIRAFYQPDSIYLTKFQGRRLVFTANEGDPKDSDDGYDEVKTGSEFTADQFGNSIPKWVQEAMGDNSRLGQLRFSKHEGLENGKYEALYTFGGRSWSIRDVDNNMELLYDSGSDIEEKTAQLCPHLFNRGSSVDSESRKSGPQPEAIKVAEIDGRLYVFVGIEKPGTVMVYSVGSDVTKPRFEQLFCDGFPNDPRSPEQLYDSRLLYGLDAEDLKFIPASKSPAGQPLLLVSGVDSGTVSVLTVDVTSESEPEAEEEGSAYNAALGLKQCSATTILALLLSPLLRHLL